MKTKTFKSFLLDYVKEMNPERSLSLFKNEMYVTNDTRLLNVYTFYLLFDSNVSNTLEEKKTKFPNLYLKYSEYKKRYKNVTLDNLSEMVKILDDFDELKQLYTSYKNLVVNKKQIVKSMYHKRITDLQNEKKISNYKIYTNLNLI